jgi:flagellar hook-associated protein 1 FlgK
MSSGLFGIGISGLTAAHTGLVTTGHNIANADTPGFHRQQTVQANATPRLSGGGFIGQGVRVDNVRRVYSDFLETQAGRAQAQASYYDTYATQVAQIDNLLSDPSAGLAPVLQSFFSGVHEVAANPGSAPSRQAMLSSAQALATRFQSLDNRLREMNTGVNTQVESMVSSVNGYAREIASLNAQIATAQTRPDQPPNDLLDQRDQLISQLNELVGAAVLVQSDGSISISIGTGQTMVSGTQAFRLQAVQSQAVPGRMDVAYVAGASSVVLPSQSLTGGRLGALLAFRAGTLTDAQNELGRIASGLTSTFNSQHRLGQDITGALGGDFFVPLQPQVTNHGANAGTAAIAATVSSASGLTASDYRLSFTGGAYQLVRLSDDTTTTYATLPQTVDGVTIQLTGGVPANGDSFLIQPTINGARDFGVALRSASQIAAAAPIRTGSANANAGSGTISAGTVNAPPDANLQQPVTITFTSATTFNVTGAGTGNPVGLAYTAGSPVTYNGWTVAISGAPVAGDTFNVVSNTGATADNRNASRLADLQSAGTLANGSASFQAAYGQLTTSVGNTTRETEISSQAQDAISQRARASQQAVSGVNLDEEAANLMRYQQAYQASGKVIEVATTLFDTILGLGR